MNTWNSFFVKQKAESAPSNHAMAMPKHRDDPKPPLFLSGHWATLKACSVPGMDFGSLVAQIFLQGRGAWATTRRRGHRV